MERGGKKWKRREKEQAHSILKQVKWVMMDDLITFHKSMIVKKNHPVETADASEK